MTFVNVNILPNAIFQKYQNIYRYFDCSLIHSSSFIYIYRTKPYQTYRYLPYFYDKSSMVRSIKQDVFGTPIFLPFLIFNFAIISIISAFIFVLFLISLQFTTSSVIFRFVSIKLMTLNYSLLHSNIDECL